MVDCPTEDVPFREGTFGGAGGHWCLYLCPASLCSHSLVLLQILTSYLVLPKRKPPICTRAGFLASTWGFVYVPTRLYYERYRGLARMPGGIHLRLLARYEHV